MESLKLMMMPDNMMFTACMVAAFTAFGFRLRRGRRAWNAEADIPPIGAGRIGVSLCLVAFAALLGLFFAAVLDKLAGIPVPGFLGGLAVAALIRNTTAMTDEEFPERETELLCLASLVLLVLSSLL